MEHLIGLIGAAVVLFASTDIDDLLVLVGFFADSKFKIRHVVVGQYLGIAGLYGGSVVASLISLVVSPAYIGLLGLVPIAIGLQKAWALQKGSEASREELDGHEKVSAGQGNALSVAAVTLANGADNISVYTPLFATRTGYDIALIGVVFAVMTLLWLGIAYRLTRHRTIGAPIRTYGHRVVPFVLISLGVLILHGAGTFGLLRRLWQS
ncbi:MAG TPA: cadmium resistance transporter [Steroidobacteraceae bacterium]|jgi:cadmium resistance protein CadD (predicted permease)|nr:cadmium resistance transporter [Steroidobacteraceae bacterium]